MKPLFLEIRTMPKRAKYVGGFDRTQIFANQSKARRTKMGPRLQSNQDSWKSKEIREEQDVP